MTISKVPTDPNSGGGATNPVTVDAEATGRQLVAGTNTTIDTATPGQIKVNAGGSSFGSNVLTMTGSVQATKDDGLILYDGSADWTLSFEPNPPLGTCHTVQMTADPGVHLLTIDVGTPNTSQGYHPFHMNKANWTYRFKGYATVTLQYVQTRTTEGFGANWVVLGNLLPGAGVMPDAEFFFLADDGNAYDVYVNESPASSGNQDTFFNDAGVGDVQFGFVHPSGGTTKQIPIWNKGPGNGGYFTLQNTFNGYPADASVTALGSGISGSIASSNTGVGQNVFNGVVTGSYNVGIHCGALSTLSSGSKNIAIGQVALGNITTQSDNIAIGYAASSNGAFIAEKTIAIGTNALSGLTVAGTGQIAIGWGALAALSGGFGCTAIGYTSQSQNIDGNFNTSLGYQALQNNQHATNNVAIGANSMISAIGGGNVAVGMNSLLGLSGTFGTNNVAVGLGALNSLTNSGNSVAIGSNALAACDDQANIGIGASVCGALVTGNSNVVIGTAAAPTLNGGSRNILLGASADVPNASTSDYINFNNQVKLGSDDITQVNGSISGNLQWSQPFLSASYKKIVINLNAFHDAGVVITFHAAFSSVPCIVGNSTGLTISTLTTSAITIPAANTTGTIVLEGF